MNKSKRATAFKKEWIDKLPGGLADKSKPDDFDPKSLEQGIKVEMEHTDDPEIAKEITMDHLKEFEDYYPNLNKMEKKMEKEHRASLFKRRLSKKAEPELFFKTYYRQFVPKRIFNMVGHPFRGDEIWSPKDTDAFKAKGYGEVYRLNPETGEYTVIDIINIQPQTTMANARKVLQDSLSNKYGLGEFDEQKVEIIPV